MATGTATTMPYVKLQFFDNNGAPAAGYKLFTYEAGTTTKLATYYTANMAAGNNTNPVVLDSSGRAAIFLAPAAYKFVLAPPTDTDPPTSAVWTVDEVAATPPFNVDLDIPATAGEALAAGECAYLSDGSGALTAGRWYKADADNTYSSTAAAAIGFAPAAISSGQDGTIRVIGRITGLSSLTTGSTYYVSQTAGAVTLTPPTNARAVGIADSTTSLLMSQWLPIPAATAAVPGLVSTGTQTFGGTKTFSAVEVTGVATLTDGVTMVAGTAARVPGTINAQFNDAATSGTGATDAHSYTMPAGMLATDGDRLVVTGYGTFTSDSNTKTIKLYFDGNALTLAANAASSSTDFTYTVNIIRRSATAVIMSGVTSYTNTILGYPTRLAVTATLSGAIVIKSELTHATSGTSTEEGFSVDFFPA